MAVSRAPPPHYRVVGPHKHGVPSEHYLWGVPAGCYPYLPYKRRGLIVVSRLQPSHGVAGKMCYASRQPRIRSENTAVFCLDPHILACPSDWRLETASRAVSVGKGEHSVILTAHR